MHARPYSAIDEACEDLLFALHRAAFAVPDALRQAESEIFLGAANWSC